MSPAHLRFRSTTVADALRQACDALVDASPSARLDAEVLIMHACGFDRSALITHGQRALTNEQEYRLNRLIERRLLGEPIAYLTGEREFWSLPLKITPATLIPRPETETLVEQALRRIPPQASWTVADLGTGSGAIALALASERPHCRIVATDRSRSALQLARENARTLGLTNVEFCHGDWIEPLGETKFDVVVSNPPYVSSGDPHLTQGDVRFEPRDTLTAGADGLEAIRRIARGARHSLISGGWLLLEHGPDQATQVAAILSAASYRDIVCHRDLAGRERASEGRLPQNI